MEGIVLLILFFIIKKICSIKIYHTPKSKGQLGERKISAILSSLPTDKCRVFNDILNKMGDRTTQIDHIIISIFGIFVIETKNYGGWITGYDNSQYWMTNIFGNRYNFYNPIRQNKGHILALSKYLKLRNDKFISIIVFLDKAHLRVNTSQNVVYMGQINKLIKQYDKVIFSQDEFESLIEKINEINFISKYDKKQHILNTQDIIEYRQYLEQQGVCPLCMHKLVLRDGKYGKFIGCSNYPKCDFVKPVE